MHILIGVFGEHIIEIYFLLMFLRIEKKIVKDVYDDIVNNKYRPSRPECDVLINKGDGVARITHVFSIRDSMVYYFCIKELESILCKNRIPNTFGGWSLGGKIRKAEELEIEKETENQYGRYSFNPQAWSRQFGDFNSLLFSQLETAKYSHAIQFDLANFYDLIRLDILEKWIRDEVNPEKEYVVDLLFQFLANWDEDSCHDRKYQVGLPQDVMQDCSRILANFYLQRYDNFTFKLCEQYHSEYFRYADDQFILTNAPENMSIFMLSISKRLDRYGLKINQKKVKLWTAHDLIIHRSRHIQMIFKDDEDKKILRKYSYLLRPV